MGRKRHGSASWGNQSSSTEVTQMPRKPGPAGAVLQSACRWGCSFNMVCASSVWGWKCSVGKVCMGLLGEGIHSTRTEAGLAGGVECNIKKLGSECWHCTLSYRLLCVYDEGWGREIAPASSFVSGDVCQQTWRLVTNPSISTRWLSILFLHCISIGCSLCCLFKNRSSATRHSLSFLRAKSADVWSFRL